MKKRIVAVLLVIALLSTTCVGVFADYTEENPLSKYTEGTGYVAIGDSITRGYCASEQWDVEGYRMDAVPENTEYIGGTTDISKLTGDDYTREANRAKSSVFCRNVTGSYTKQIATALGCYAPDNMTISDAEYWPIAHDGMQSDIIVDLLGIENEFTDTEYVTKDNAMLSRYESDLYYFGSPDSYLVDGSDRYINAENYKEAAAKDLCSLVNDASLITLNLGMGEILNRSRIVAMRKYDIKTQTVECASELVSLLYDGYNLLTEQYPLILNYIKENNPDCTVILMGAINPLYGMTLTDETIIPVGNAASAITMLMNQQYKKWAEEYGFIYLDISNVDTGTVVNDTNFIDFMSSKNREQGIATHPTASGYTQIARMVINALEEKEKESKENVENIVVDLGRYTNVNYVLVDGILIDPSQYSVENYKLTVKCNNKYAKSLTVAVVDGSKKKTSLMAYQLTYDHGYTAYRCYQTNDVVKTVSKPVSLVKKAGSWFVGLFK